MEGQRVAVNVCNPSRKPLRIAVDLQFAVLKLKEKICEQTKVPTDCQEVLFGSTILQNDVTIASIYDDSARMLDVTLVVTCENLLHNLLLRSKKADKVLVQWLQNDPVRSAITVQALVDRTNALEMRMGFMTRGNDLLVEVMTFGEARVRCLTLHGCVGFTFEAEHASLDEERDKVKVYFKSMDYFCKVQSPYRSSYWKSFFFTEEGFNFKKRFLAVRLMLLADRVQRGEPAAINETSSHLNDDSLDIVLIATMAISNAADFSAPMVAAFTSRILACHSYSGLEGNIAVKLMKVLCGYVSVGDESAIKACCACLDSKDANQDLEVHTGKVLARIALGARDGSSDQPVPTSTWDPNVPLVAVRRDHYIVLHI
jgi:hypothetical protein